MRGQEYTVMNYLVWAAFAFGFLVVVYAAYNAIASRGCQTAVVQIRDLLRDAGKLDTGCVQTKGYIILCPQTTISEHLIRTQMGLPSSASVQICGGPGVIVENGVARTERTTKAIVGVCKCGSNVKFCINNASCYGDPCSPC